MKNKNRNGSYYSKTKNSKKYYYIVGDVASRNIAKQQAQSQGIKEGDGLISNSLAWLTSKFTPNTMSDRLKRRLKIDGATPIIKMIYSRKAISGNIKTALNVLTFGKLTQKQRDLKYPQIFHDSVIIY